MSWQQNFVILRNGERIRYALFEKEDRPGYYVRFKGKDGRYMKPSTGCSRKVDAIKEAHRIILEHYESVIPKMERVTWDEAKAKLEEAMLADNKRPKTIKGYIETLNRLIEMFPQTRGPGDLSEFLAYEFKVKYANGKFSRRRKKREDDDIGECARKTVSLDSRLRTLKAVFSWFIDLHLMEKNPFEHVEQPEMDRHEVKYVTREDLMEFFAWLEGRYVGWRMPHLFFTVKAMTGCRLDDLCNIRSEQLIEGRLVFSADQTKNRSERYALLPDDVYLELEAYKGETYLWERYPAELRQHARGLSKYRVIEFSTHRLYMWVVSLFQDYQQETGRDLSSHDFRKAAFTRAAEADIHPKRAAVAFDVRAETMLKYYTATEKKRTADDVLSELQDALRPRKASTGKES
jgi:integrase